MCEPWDKSISSIDAKEMDSERSMTGESPNDERKFLHDLATPLGAAILLTDSMLDDVQNRPGTDPDDLMRLGEIYKALDKINTQLKQRRQILISRGTSNAGS